MAQTRIASYYDSAAADPQGEVKVTESNPLPAGRPIQEALEILASGARTATDTGDAVSVKGNPDAVEFELDVTAAATEAGDTLDVFVQTTIDGTNWIDVVAFTQVTGDGGAKRHIAKISRSAAEAMFENGATLAAGSVRNILGKQYRARWVVTDVVTADNQSFTFSVVANAL